MSMIEASNTSSNSSQYIIPVYVPGDTLSERNWALHLQRAPVVECWRIDMLCIQLSITRGHSDWGTTCNRRPVAPFTNMV